MVPVLQRHGRISDSGEVPVRDVDRITRMEIPSMVEVIVK